MIDATIALIHAEDDLSGPATTRVQSKGVLEKGADAVEIEEMVHYAPDTQKRQVEMGAVERNEFMIRFGREHLIDVLQDFDFFAFEGSQLYALALAGDLQHAGDR